MRALGWIVLCAGAVAARLLLWPDQPSADLAIAPFVIPAVMAGASFLGGLFGNKSKQTSQPTFDPAFSPLRDQLLQMTMARLRNPSALPAGYETGQIGNINRTFDIIGQSQANNLTARGLGSSPIAGAVDANREIARGGQIVEMQRTLPLLERQMRMEDLLQAQGLLGMGRGQTTTGTVGGGIGGGISDMASMLGWLAAMGKIPGFGATAGG